jgi:hypothetical protein
MNAPSPDLKLITTGTHADWFLLDRPPRADFQHRWNAGTHRAEPEPTPPREVDWFALGKDICSRDLPAGVQR